MNFFDRAEQETHHLKPEENYGSLHDHLRVALLELQQQLKKADFSVMVVIAGVDGGGKGSTLRQINEWLDPRFIRTFALPIEDKPLKLPPLWRFWQNLPRKGRIGLYAGSWYSKPITDRIHHHSDEVLFAESLTEINRFEKLLVDEGTLIIKLWLHLDKPDQKERIEMLASNPETAWRVSEKDRRHLHIYEWFREVSSEALTQTDTMQAPWNVIYGKDPEFRQIQVARVLQQRISQRLALESETEAFVSEVEEPPLAAVKSDDSGMIQCERKTLLDELDLSQKLK